MTGSDSATERVGPVGGGVGDNPGMSGVAAAGAVFLCRYACTIPMSAFSVNACKFATIRSVTRFAGKELKSKPGEVAAAVSCSSFTRLESGASTTGVLVDDRLRDASRAAVLRAFSSDTACSIR